MIHYKRQPFDFLWVIIRLRGSVLPRSVPIAAVSAALSFCFLYFGLVQIENPGGKVMHHPNPFTFFLQVAALMLAFHTNAAYQRFWEGRTALQAMSTYFGEAASQVIAFDSVVFSKELSSLTRNLPPPDPRKVQMGEDISTQNAAAAESPPISATTFGPRIFALDPSGNKIEEIKAASGEKYEGRRDTALLKPGVKGLSFDFQETVFETNERKPINKLELLDVANMQQLMTVAADCQDFRFKILHLLSLLHAVCIQYLLNQDGRGCRLEILGGVSNEESRALSTSADHAYLVNHWVDTTLAHRVAVESGLPVGLPIVSRIWAELSGGLQAFNHACKIEDTPFPFPYIQLLYLIDAAVTILSPIVVSSWIPNIPLAVTLVFLVVFAFHSLFLAAYLMETPFGRKPNDLPLLELHADFIGRLKQLVEPPLFCGLGSRPPASDSTTAPDHSTSLSDQKGQSAEQLPLTEWSSVLLKNSSASHSYINHRFIDYMGSAGGTKQGGDSFFSADVRPFPHEARESSTTASFGGEGDGAGLPSIEEVPSGGGVSSSVQKLQVPVSTIAASQRRLSTARTPSRTNHRESMMQDKSDDLSTMQEKSFSTATPSPLAAAPETISYGRGQSPQVSAQWWMSDSNLRGITEGTGHLEAPLTVSQSMPDISHLASEDTAGSHQGLPKRADAEASGQRNSVALNMPETEGRYLNPSFILNNSFLHTPGPVEVQPIERVREAFAEYTENESGSALRSTSFQRIRPASATAAIPITIARRIGSIGLAPPRASVWQRWSPFGAEERRHRRNSEARP